MPYPYPPLVPVSPAALAATYGASLGRAWRDVQGRYDAVLASANLIRKEETLAQLAELLAEVERFQGLVGATAARLAGVDIPVQYAVGARRADRFGSPFAWTGMHEEAAGLLGADSYADLLRNSEEAGRTSQAFARQVRTVARERGAFTATGRYTSAQVGAQLADRLRATGLSVVTYANGAQVPMGAYTEMAVLTKAAVANNAGSVNRYAELGIGWVEVMDGSGCGWTSHDDMDRANGSIRTLEDAANHPIAHPRCRRALGARPDVTNAKEAAAARASTTAEQRADQAASEQVRADVAAPRAAVAARDRRVAARATRTPPPASSALPAPSPTVVPWEKGNPAGAQARALLQPAFEQQRALIGDGLFNNLGKVTFDTTYLQPGWVAGYWKGTRTIYLRPMAVSGVPRVDAVTRQRRLIKQGWWSKGETDWPVSRSVHHEIGHHIHRQAIEQLPNLEQEQFWAGLADDLEVASPAKLLAVTQSRRTPARWVDAHHSQLREVVSEYGASNEGELLAEIWAEYSIMGSAARPAIFKAGRRMQTIARSWK